MDILKYYAQKSKAFTLVELIIVITILAILATISFLSFQSYTVVARDSQRLTSLNSIEKSINIYYTNTSIYPTPDNIYLT
jgi:prepilin-type N-terminal cleavage/methylation domain-containing protein